MERRKFLTTSAGVFGVVSIAGCSGGDGGDGGDGGEEEEEQRDIELIEHKFLTEVYSGLDMEVTVENVSDEKIGLVSIRANMFVDNERVDDGGGYISDLPAGTVDSETVALADVGPHLDDITHYEINIEANNQETTHEFDEFSPPE